MMAPMTQKYCIYFYFLHDLSCHRTATVQVRVVLTAATSTILLAFPTICSQSPIIPIYHIRYRYTVTPTTTNLLRCLVLQPEYLPQQTNLSKRSFAPE